MAQDKKSFVLYSDLLKSIDHLTNEEKGILFNHLLEYVNDLNPVLEDRLILTAWRPIELQLKRDLIKFNEVKAKRSDAGKKSAEIKALNKLQQDTTNSTSVESVQQTSTNSTDNVNDNVNDTVIYNNLMSEIKISDVALDMQIYFNCAEAFRKLFIKIAQREGLPTKIYDKAKYKDYVTPIRLAVEADGYTIEQIRQSYNYLNSSFDTFWYKNIRSAKKLRQQLDKLVLEFNKVNKTA